MVELKELLIKFNDYIKKSKSIPVEKVMADLDISELDVYGLVSMSKKNGMLIDIIDGKIMKIQPPKENDVYEIKNSKDHLKLLMISDTHLCSKYDRLDILRYLYNEAEDKNVDYIMHSGDVTDGKSNRPQQIYELKECSYEGQRDYVIDKYPKSDIKTIMIPGNHDLWWVKECGSNIVKDIGKNRDDLICLDTDCEDLKIGKIRYRLYHGYGSESYAKSYKLQKFLDRIPTEELPDIMQTGHVHNAFYMKQGKTHCFQTSCLEDITPFARSLGYSNDKSCWWADINLDDNGKIAKVSQELETFSKVRVRK